MMDMESRLPRSLDITLVDTLRIWTISIFQEDDMDVDHFLTALGERFSYISLKMSRFKHYLVPR